MCFTTAVACIGYSARERLEVRTELSCTLCPFRHRGVAQVNSVCVPRKAGEAVGAIAKLEKADGSSITCNVEYNQLAPLLK